ncbi:hypothetical protein [Proteiniborus sp.]|uniref:hypothetical protein n=1 Tax=Proteiniborus sp. TaxID=2079015 RepID=UPI00331CB74E
MVDKKANFLIGCIYRREYGEVIRTTICSIRNVKKKVCYAICRSEQLLENFDEFKMI